ncbi:MAG: clostripain-related cysteine peptidase, partial [Odoribacter sp.]|nr:clostripain-related cysteine peptidase [Odoribacter sp.]
IYTFILFSALFVSCDKGEEGIKEDKSFTRTILVYMGGNSNLSSQTYQKLDALMKGWNSSFKGNLLVFQHATGDSPRLLEVSNTGEEISLITLRNYEEENSASPTTFRSIIDEMKTLYPADSYGLILFSHGSGWLPTGTLESPRSVVIDRKEEMEIREFANVIPTNCFDFIVFEACFMAGIEVAYELKDKTSYIVASSAEILTPGFTKIYPHSISYLYEQNPNLTAFTQTAFNYFNSLYGDNRSATFSIINTGKLRNLGDWIKRNWDNENIDVNLNEI